MEVHIFMSKKGQKQKRYSAEFKTGVIMDMRENFLGYRETVRKHWQTQNRSEEELYKGTVKKWERIYLEEGAEGLMEERRGKNNTGSKRGRPPKLDRKVEEDLIAENQRLRMEIEYLKKLDALVRKREQEEEKKQ